MKLKSIVFCIALGVAASGIVRAQGRGGPGLTSLKSVKVPEPTNLALYVKDRKILVALGKAFFWDTQAGSDGHTSCATCHFHAGADHRLQNMISVPATAGGAITANQILNTSSFPFHQLANVASNTSAVVKDSHQVAGSAGMFRRSFAGLAEGNLTENAVDIPGGLFSVGGLNVRQVTNRNAPSVINAVFNVRNFWDGRAGRLFTGQTPFGVSDTGLNVAAFRNGQLTREAVAMDNASLASQAVGPLMNSGEMSYDGRSWSLLGRKMLASIPLARQVVAADDSLLGTMANPAGNGLRPEYNYPTLIQAAFQSDYWIAPDPGDGQFTQMETNFSLFWGLAIQAYESTLISDATRLDRFLEGDRQALSALEQQGFQVFQQGNSQCTQCHQGPEFTAASYSNAGNAAVRNNDPDSIGFFRTAVTPIADDIGLGGTDGFGLALFLGPRGIADGTFKSPGLRNVEFTGPYFHNGSQASLEQVVQFYARNGDFPAEGNLGNGIGRITLNSADQTALVAFLKALSDDRVSYEQAPFDHPSLCLPNGAAETSPGVLAADTSDPRFTSSAVEKFALIPAVGQGGNKVPLQTFAELLSGVGRDGSRAHALVDACTP